VTHNCHHLDAYFDGELAPADRASFECHLASCPECREAIDEQNRIDALLGGSALANLEAPPPALVEQVGRTLHRRRRFARLAACGLAASAAAVLLVGIAWTTGYSRPEAALGPPVSAAPVQNDSEPWATFVGGPDVIVMPIESESPDVTIVRVYPVFEPDFSDQVSLDPIAAGDGFAWPELNGG
jgi:anti-sigma factor RsiW